MEGELHLGTYSPPLVARDAGLSHAAGRWGSLAYFAALAFVVQLYANPAFYWESLDVLRLGVAAAALCTFAVVMRRVVSGEALRFGGLPSTLLFAYVLTIPLSFAWTISADRTMDATVDMLKVLVVYVALVNALDAPDRLRTFLTVGSLATLAPSIGAIQRWLTNDNLVEGYRAAWRGNYADPNRCAMGLVLFLPATIVAIGQARRPWLKAVLLVAAVSNVTAIVLTHSRSGAVALAAALALTLLRGRKKGRGLVLGAIAVAALVALAPQSFWKRSESIGNYEYDVSFAGRERAWEMLKVIAAERPFTGVGASAFIDAWDRFAPLDAQGQHLIAHNIFMEIQGEQGAIALLLFGIYTTWLLVHLWRAGADGPGGPVARAIFAGFVGYLICELVNGYTRSFHLFTGFALGIVAIAHAQLRARLAAEEAKP
jgi:putative inorganic carbon (hco3(-)) transporter